MCSDALFWVQVKGATGLMPPTTGGAEELEAKRAALREKLAQKLKDDLVKQAF